MDRLVFLNLEDETEKVADIYRDVLSTSGRFNNPDSRRNLQVLDQEEFTPYARDLEQAIDAAEDRVSIMNTEDVPKNLEISSLMGLKTFYDSVDVVVELEQEYAERAEEHGLNYTPFSERIDNYPEGVEQVMEEIENLRDKKVEEDDYDFLRGY